MQNLRSGWGLRAAVLLLSLMLLSGCASTRVTSEWKDPAFNAEPMHAFVVVGISPDGAARRNFEDTLSGALTAEGATAVTSYSLLGEEEPTLERLKPLVAGTGTQGILVTRLIGTDEETVYYPPSWRPVPVSYRSYNGYYRQAIYYNYRPGYVAQYKLVKLETNLYRVDTGDLVWSMQTESMDPSSSDRLIDELVPLSIRRLKENGLL